MGAAPRSHGIAAGPARNRIPEGPGGGRHPHPGGGLQVGAARRRRIDRCRGGFETRPYSTGLKQAPHFRRCAMITELIKGNRSYRRFHQEVPVSLEVLKGLVDLARLSASAANLQPLKYLLSCEPAGNAAIFSCLAWAGYLKDWPGPSEGEQPAAYI